MDGVSFLRSNVDAEPVWGSGDEALWAPGQGFMVFGSDGAGKSALGQETILARLGLGDGKVLGHQVEQSDRPVLYLALDRPEQIRRSISRMVDLESPSIYDRLKRKLVVWAGSLPFECDDDPGLFARWCVEIGGDDLGMVFVDSVKDMVSSCTDDSAGMGFNDTVQKILEAGVEFGCCHHNRKSNAQNAKPRALADVYGSRWLTAGLGSVLNIWMPTESVRELTQLKTPYGNPIKPIEYGSSLVNGASKQSPNYQDDPSR